MKIKKFYYLSVIVVTLTLLFSFIAYVYYADVDAVSKTKVEIEDINLLNIYTNGVIIGFTVRFINPSYREIKDLSSKFDIYVDSNYIGSGSFSNINIEQRSYTSKTISITVTYYNLAQSTIEIIKDFIFGERTSFSIQGTLTADVLFGLTETSYNFITTIYS